MRVSKLLSNKLVTYPRSRIFIEIQVDGLPLALVHHFRGDHGMGMGIGVGVGVGFVVRIGLSLGLGLEFFTKA